MSIDQNSAEETHRVDRSAVREDTGEEGYVQLKNVTKTFDNGQVIATEDVNLSIASSEFVVLLGPSGCGKTTTLRCIAGLEIPDSGQIIVDNEDITNKKPKDRDLAYVFQSIALFPHMTVRENMRFGLDMKSDLSADEKNERVENAAAILEIEELLERKPAALSGGQQQRVALGRAMTMEPDVFLLDEPFSALDANLRDQMRIEVKMLQRELETAMIFVTHDQEEAMTIGDTIVVMNKGRIMQIGTPYDIYNEPENEFVARFIGSPSPNFFDCTIRETDGAYVLEHDLFSVELPASPDNLPVDSGETVTMGIRPEYVTVDPDGGLFDTEITVIEPHGSRDSVYFDMEGTELTATTPQNALTEEDGIVRIGFDREEIWLFKDGQRIF